MHTCRKQHNLLQVAVLAPLALLLVPEARCVHFVMCSSINIHHCSHTAHKCIHDDKLVTRYKDVSEHNRDCNGNSSAHVQGRRQLDLVIRSM